MHTAWKIWIDTGGTFTDCLAISPAGNYHRLKILSSSVLRGRVVKKISSTCIKVNANFLIEQDIFREFTIVFFLKKSIQRKITQVDVHQSLIFIDKPISVKEGTLFEITSREEVPVLAARILTGTSLNSVFPSIELKLGSTKGTNALLERKGANTAFIVTKGFKDLLIIGNQQRPDLFSLKIEKPRPLYATVLEVDERIEFDGNVLKPLSTSEIERTISLLKKKDIHSVAIAFVNSYKNAKHELKLAKALQDEGIEFVSLSHQLSSQIRILPRAETAIVNAYLQPVIHNYLSRIKQGVSLTNFRVMSSAGGLLSAESFHPKDSLLSGPAGGVMGAIKKGKASRVERIITFDMGGTSTDVSLSNGRPEYRFESSVGDSKILSPSLAIETIAAGGGSVCDFDGYKFTVGPESAGAFPGPACYGASGPLTITDVNLLLGKLDENNFSIPLHRGDAVKKLEIIKERVYRHSGKKYSNEIILESFVQIANEKMAEAIRKVSVQNGYDPSEYALVSFGGAGGQHACNLASMLGIQKILVPYDAGLLSAYGIGHSTVERIEEKLILEPIDKVLNDFNEIVDELFLNGCNRLVHEGYDRNNISIKEKLVYLRLQGQETSLEVSVEFPGEIIGAFKRAYRKIYGHWISGRTIEVESVRIRIGTKEIVEATKAKKLKKYVPIPQKQSQVWLQNSSFDCNVYRWEQLKPGAFIYGPSIVISNNSTQFIEKNWSFLLTENNNALITKSERKFSNQRIQAQETQLELFTNRFTSIAQEMGAMLQRTAFSVNVKERLDFSCALLDLNGNLVVNAPHIPVHLGSLGVCVRSVRKVIELSEGDVVITNHPAFGGSHLPDVTLIKPIFVKKKLVGFVANRAHHAEIGGKQPGSMPANATCLEEEGVVITPTYLVKNGKARWKEVESLFTNAKYPTRSVRENMADLNAALAALQYGEQALIALCSAYGIDDVSFYMKRLTDYTASLMKEAIQDLKKKNFKAVERLDNGAKLQVSITAQKNKLTIDFTGSANEQKGNLNATTAIVNSVVLYVLRLLLDKKIPLNEGLLKHVKIIVPRGILNPKFHKDSSKSPAVVGGNTEISQRLTDTLLKAFGLAACSQGTMNNLLFGNSTFGYYETICGGTGAGNNFNGANAVHQHMTNTRITDVEIMEWRYPVRVKRFEVRKNSGGNGKYKGGDGITREILFKDHLQLNVLTQHRVEKPYGVSGGEPGKVGEQVVIRNNGKKEKLFSVDGITIEPNDRIIINTPGGGGWGKKK